MKRTLKDKNINLTDNFPETPADFAELISNGKWKRAPQLELINQLLVSLTLRKEKKVIVNLPPRHGKSEFISKFFPAWYMMKNKTHRIILTSYGNKFSASWGKKVLQIIENWGEKLANIKISPKSKSASSFDLEEFGGGMDCVGISGALTGKGADLLIIDDPIKNDKEAHSKKIRDNIWEWFLSTAFTRLEPDGIIIIVMTRWHEDDLVGRIIEKKDIKEQSNTNVFDWKFIKLPAIAEETDFLGRNPGEALWRERFNSQKLLEIREVLGSYWFEALYQQNPRPAGGEIFKRKFFKYYYEDLEHYYLRISSASNNKQVKIVRKIDCSLFATVDLAISTKNSSDFTVIIVFGLTPDKEIILLDLIRDRIIGSEHLNLIRDVFKRWEGIIVGIESVQYQASLIQTFEREGLKVIALKPIKDKLSRALPISAKLEAGYVFFPENSHWLKNFEDELLAFPNSKYDDQVDAFSYISFLIEKISLSTPASSLLKKLTKNNITSNF